MASDDDSRSAELIACAVTFQVLSGFFVAARFYSRGVVTRALGREDYCILTAWLVALGYTIPSVISGSIAMGRHIWTVTPESMKMHMKLSYINTILYQISLAFSKISILLLYLRVLAYTYARRAAFIVLAIVIIYNILGFISTLTICKPIQAFWDPEVHGRCHPDSYMWAVIGLHITTDFLIFLLPLPVVYRMSLPSGQKFGVMLVFALGFIVCLISILRAVRIHDLYYTPDITWDYVEIHDWTAVELNISILIPCVIVLKPLLAKLFPRLASPEHSASPPDAPPTIGSDPTACGRGNSRVGRGGGDVERDVERGVELDPGPSEKSSVCNYEHREKETRHLEHSVI